MDISVLAEKRSTGPLLPEEVKRILHLRKKLGSSGENQWLEFKSRLSQTGHAKGESWVKLLGSIVSMANAGGGYIILGVGRTGDLIGVEPDVVAMLDPARIEDKLARYCGSPSLVVDVTHVTWYGKDYASLWVGPSSKLMVFDKDGDYFLDDGTRPEKGFYAGVVYTRGQGGRRPATQRDLDDIVSRLLQEHTKSFLAKIETVARAPEDSAIILTDPAHADRAYRFTESDEGQPVRITDDPDEPALPVREILRPGVPYPNIVREVAAMVRQWKTNPSFRLGRMDCYRWYLARDGVRWDGDAAELAYRSACVDFGFPMFWARLLFDEGPGALRRVIREQIALDKHPEITCVPYVIGAFLWQEREGLLAEVARSKSKSPKERVDKVRRFTTRRALLLRGRSPGQTLVVGDRRYALDQVADDLELARHLFDEVVESRRDGNEDPRVKMAGHQLDLLVHAPALE